MMDKYEYQYMYLQGLKKNLQARGYIASKYFRKDEIDCGVLKNIDGSEGLRL